MWKYRKLVDAATRVYSKLLEYGRLVFPDDMNVFFQMFDLYESLAGSVSLGKHHIGL